jgi:ornithine cyclodeaminase/alanine dehydrogenase-like protein (mu-crystallin family)
VRVITRDELLPVLRFEDLIDPVAAAFVSHSRGQATSDLIAMYPAATPCEGDVYVKTGTMTGSPSYVVKISPWFAVNAGAGRRQGGFIAVFDARTGYTTAIIDDQHLLSDLRTAAAGALAARYLAPAQVGTALVIGTGTQAFWQPQALARECTVDRLLVWGRDISRAEALTDRLRAALPDTETKPISDLARGVEAADVVLAATAAREPLVRGEWLRPGQHITSVGSDDQTKAELDAGCLRRADRVIVDSATAAKNNGNVHRHLASGEIGADAITGEIGHVIDRTIPGRTSGQELTVATLIGIGVQDLAAATVAVQAVERHG